MPGVKLKNSQTKPRHTDRDLILLGRAVVVAEVAQTRTGERRDRVAEAAAELGWTEQSVVTQALALLNDRQDARAFRAFRPVAALPDRTYFTTPAPGEREGMRFERIGSDVKIILPSGRTECWSDAALVKPNAAPTFTALTRNDMDRAAAKDSKKAEWRRMTPEEAEAATKPVVIAAPKRSTF